MKQLLTPARLYSRTRREAGIALILVACCLMLLIGFAALAVDGSHIFKIRTHCQSTADSAALAAASMLPDLAAARSAAIAYGAKNMDPSLHGRVIGADDVEFGTWDFDTRTFTVATHALETNAVRVTAHRSTANNNALKLSLGQALGFTSTDVTTKAVAAFLTLEPWDILLTQDVTLSFIEELDYAKQADQNLLDCMAAQSPAETMFGIVTFTGWGKQWAPLQPLAANHATLQLKINNIQACGHGGMPVCSGTDIAAGLERAVGMLNASPYASDHKQAIVLVSDGRPEANLAGSHPTFTQSELETLATQWADTAWSNDIHIFVVYFDGTGSTTAKDFVKSLIRGEGIFLSTPDATELPELLSGICGKLIDLRLVD